MTGKQVHGWYDSISGERAGWRPTSTLILAKRADYRHSIHRVETGASIESLKLASNCQIVVAQSGKTGLLLNFVERTSAYVGRLFSVVTGKPIGPSFDAEYVGDTALSPDGSVAAIVDDQLSNRFRLFATHTGKIVLSSADPTFILASKPSMGLLNRLSDMCATYGVVVPDIPTAGSVVEPAAANNLPADARRRLIRQETVALRKSIPGYEDPGPYSAADEAIPVACLRAGWNLLAMELLANKLKEFRGDVLEEVALDAWETSENELLDYKRDRAAVEVFLKRILDDYPELRTEHKKAVIKLLDLSLASASHRNQGIEGEIDDLATEESRQIDVGFSGFQQVEQSGKAARSLYLRGFEAVPALIEHSGDMRLTRGAIVGMDRYPSHIATVGEIVSGLLINLAGNTTIVDHGRMYSDVDSREYIDRKLVTKWWKRAGTKSEEQYLVDNILPEKDTAESEPNNSNAALLASKYPARLPEVYIKLITSFPHIRSNELSRLLAENKVGGSDTAALLVRAATTGGVDQREGAFWALASIKFPRTAELLAKRLDNLPAKADGEYWRSEPTNLVSVVQSIDDQRAWNALSRLARRSVPGQKLAIVCQFETSCVCSDPSSSVIHFLLPFVDDHTELNLKKGELEESGFMITSLNVDRITISDAALMGIGDQFKINSFFASDWTKTQWSEFRVNVRAALDKWQKSRASSEPAAKVGS